MWGKLEQRKCFTIVLGNICSFEQPHAYSLTTGLEMNTDPFSDDRLLGGSYF
jgi:hypothetical protein